MGQYSKKLLNNFKKIKQKKRKYNNKTTKGILKR